MALKLLIADDDPNDATLVAYRVKRAGYTVDWRQVDDETGFARELPGADLVICDFSMPRFSPLRALEMIRESGRATPLLLVSGNVPAECADRLIRLGAAGHVHKDCLDRLAKAVRDALGEAPAG
ncbi:MAG TPA: response regulator [Kofleriaceae bacterium]|jgi:CheY-like chemotaxis protein